MSVRVHALLSDYLAQELAEDMNIVVNVVFGMGDRDRGASPPPAIPYAAVGEVDVHDVLDPGNVGCSRLFGVPGERRGERESRFRVKVKGRPRQARFRDRFLDSVGQAGPQDPGVCIRLVGQQMLQYCPSRATEIAFAHIVPPVATSSTAAPETV
jgi:hypothetical protein